MNRSLRLCVATVIFGILSIAATEAQAQNVALGRPIIDGSGSWPNEAYTAGTFPALYVTDGSKFEPDDNASVVTYWLGREGDVTEHFTLDLGEPRNIDEVRLFNTHNRQFNDRMTDEFVLYAANEVDVGNQLIDSVVILSANLSNVADQVDIIGDAFTPANGLAAGVQARYLRFETLTAKPGLINVGLNEIEVFDFAFVNPNLAAGKPIIDGSGSWPNDPFNGPNFPASRVTDESPAAYWLGREGMPAEHVTIDLENVRNIQEIRLSNTSNGGSNDRGTRNFRVLASDTVDASNQLVDPQVILQGRLPNIAGLSPASQAMVFTDDNGLVPTDARYLRFESLSAYYDGAGTGVGEIEVYNTERHSPSPLLREGNIAAGKPVIGGTGAWNGGVPCDPATPFNGGPFPARLVTDESMADANTGRSSYWLGREACPNEYFILDLEGLYDLDEIVLQNSHNTQFNDRGTGEFVIYGSQAVDASNELVDEFVVLASELTNTSGQSVLTEDGFFIDPALPPVRYLKFQAITILSSATNSGAGLNEFQAYGTFIPEPSSWALATVGAIAAGWVARRRVRQRRN